MRLFIAVLYALLNNCSCINAKHCRGQNQEGFVASGNRKVSSSSSASASSWKITAGDAGRKLLTEFTNIFADRYMYSTLNPLVLTAAPAPSPFSPDLMTQPSGSSMPSSMPTDKPSATLPSGSSLPSLIPSGGELSSTTPSVAPSHLPSDMPSVLDGQPSATFPPYLTKNQNL